jgi:WD40 repeat protein
VRVRGVRGVAFGVALLASLAFAVPAHATFPGANGKIAFAGYRGGYSDPSYREGIFTIDPDGGGEAFLTEGSWPRWSPDGTKLVVMSDPFGTAMYTMNSDGSGRAPLGPGVTPSWSPDGRKIVFVDNVDGYSELWVMNADGTGRDPITSYQGDASPIGPAWSPRDDRIAYVVSAGGVSRIHVINPDGTGDQTLPSGNYASRVDWSPDATKILFTGQIDDGYGSDAPFVINPDGTGLARVGTIQGDRSIPVSVYGFAFSPDGTKIIYTRAECNFHGFCAYALYLANADGSDPIFFASGQNYDATFTPDWQPIVNQEPDCSGVTASPASLRSHDHHFRTVTLSGASDPDGDAVSITIDGVTQDEPVGHRPDARTGLRSNQVSLRAERDNKGDGRVYRIAFTASDGNGGSCSGVATVEVRRKKNQPAVDSAPPSYDSFG